ncbi:hypothetical protein [Halovivax limisalsi]|uniref:hypothetical protein n=1 Tax=Halovivax limisalsi TaxID=1453760 RepID=UPI001FFCAF3A|nr:hypothetical protein [Halovivax limisalsi]
MLDGTSCDSAARPPQLAQARAGLVVTACTGALAAIIRVGPALETLVFGALVTASLTALFVAVAARIGPCYSPTPVCRTRSLFGRVSTGDTPLHSSGHVLAASLSLAVAAAVLFAWSTGLDAPRSGLAAATLAGGLSHAVLGSQLPRS